MALDAVTGQADDLHVRPGPSGLRVQRVILDCPPALRDLYWRCPQDAPVGDRVDLQADGALRIGPDATVVFDTYFNALFEHHWRRHTRALRFALHVELDGHAMLRLWRVTERGGAALLHEAQVAGTADVALPHDAPNFRQAGLVWFELTATDGPAVLRRAEWFAAGADPEPVRLGVAICTFNREVALAGVLAAIAGDAALDADPGGIARVFVINQGRPDLLAHPAVGPQAARLGDRLRVVEQCNFGGAGGFGRGLLEALDDPAVTHVAFLDDDVRLEPESLLRMAAFFALARGTLCLGGHMLDAVRPTYLYECGAVMRDNWALHALSHQLDLRSRDVLAGLLDAQAVHYSGWWLFGFPKRIVAEHGMPLPCFIRGDDVEWGMRLHGRGVPTVALPGVGIWHEPFYLKGGGWQLYYETRNTMICAALHMDFSSRHVVAQVLKLLMTHLLTYRYYGAALIVRAAEDFLRGPAIVDADPRVLHASLAGLRDLHPEGTWKREAVLWDAPVTATPRSRLATVASLAASLLRNGLKPSAPAARPRRLLLQDLVWFRIGRCEALAIETYWDRELPVLRRDRAQFRTLLYAGLRVLRALHAAAPELRTAWQREAARVTSVRNWRAYLGLPPAG